MIYFDRKNKRVWLRYYLCFVDSFAIEWRQNVNKNEKVVGIGFFNKQKRLYKKMGYGDAMYRRIVELGKKRSKK